MSKKQQDYKIRDFLQRHKRHITALLIAFMLLFILAELTGWSGQVQFYSKWVECGQKPVKVATSYKPRAVSYEESPTFKLVRFSPAYFCTPLEAEQAGYSANPDTYEFPHIQEQKRGTNVE